MKPDYGEDCSDCAGAIDENGKCLGENDVEGYIPCDGNKEKPECGSKIVCDFCGSGNITQEHQIMVLVNDPTKAPVEMTAMDFFWCLTCDAECHPEDNGS